MSSKNVGRLNVSRETYERLELFGDLVKKWSAKINLVSKRDQDDLWDRHIVDSVQVFEVAGGDADWLDIGSGGGFPGLVVAILSHELAPNRRVTLMESDIRKSVFLRTVAREVGITCDVVNARIELAAPQGSPILSARALANLTTLLEFAERHLDKSGVGIFPKGENWKNELSAAKERWLFECEEITSWTEPNAAILRIRDIARV
ncbi:MAG: 16S rRNA (guanine(527)-N(7))-methyltransferase RsmG [Arenibacterium sp.]